MNTDGGEDMEESNPFKPLADFRLWVVGFAALAVMSLLTFVVPMQGAQMGQTSGWGGLADSAERVSSQDCMTEFSDAFWAPLTYLVGGVAFGAQESTLGVTSRATMSLRSNPLWGTVLLLAFFLLACIWTRRSASSWFVVVPVWTGLLLSMFYLLSKLSGTGAKLAWFGLLFWILVTPLIAALGANRLALWLSNRGVRFFDMIDVEDDGLQPRFCSACGNTRLIRRNGVYYCRRCGRAVQYLLGDRTIRCPERLGGCGRDVAATVQFCPWCGFWIKKDDFQPTTAIGIGGEWRVGV